MPGSLGSRRRRAGLALALVTLAAEAGVLVARGWPPAGDVVVRCRRGHLFTTIWIPGVSLTSLRLGWWRFQHCPVGGHWSLVTPVTRAALTADESRDAAAAHDLRIP